MADKSGSVKKYVIPEEDFKEILDEYGRTTPNAWSEKEELILVQLMDEEGNSRLTMDGMCEVLKRYSDTDIPRTKGAIEKRLKAVREKYGLKKKK